MNDPRNMNNTDTQFGEMMEALTVQEEIRLRESEQEQAEEERKKPQWQRVLNYMQTHDHISSAIAWEHLRITSLHRRLTDIKKRGYEIDVEQCFPEGRPHYFKYRLRQRELF